MPLVDATIIYDLIKIGGYLAVVLSICAYAVLAERRISAFIQDRLGPNRVGLPIWFRRDGTAVSLGNRWAIGQPLVDFLKFIFKEDVVPGHVNKLYYVLAPCITMIPALLVIAVIPFGPEVNGIKLVIADLNVGILWVFAIASLGVYGIVIAGWASNSKYPFLGGIRSSAQMISYEISMGLSVIPVIMHLGGFTTNGLSLSELIRFQVENAWLIVYPWMWLPFLVYLISAFAETNRLPFDLPESETELVAGYHTEYSSMKFALFFLAEYSNMVTQSALMVTMFFGGWSFPGVPSATTSIGWGFVAVGIFLAKVVAFLFLYIWVRWTLPRFRYDQLMHLGWKVLLPLALANILIVAGALAAWD